jgi:hypothetical protein
MNIQQAIDNDYCIMVETKEDAKRLLPYLRGRNLGFSYPIYAYSPISAHRGSIGLGFQCTNEWQGRKKEVVNLTDLK